MVNTVRRVECWSRIIAFQPPLRWRRPRGRGVMDASRRMVPRQRRALARLKRAPFPADTVLMKSRSPARIAAPWIVAIVVIAGLSSCGSKVVPTRPSPGPPRTYRMGFSAIPPKADFALLLQSLEMWRTRSDAAIMHISPPWDTLLAGYSADSAVIKLHLDLANYFKGS